MEKTFVDWTTKEIADANDKLNASYFKTGVYKKHESYFKLKEAFEYILSNDRKRPLSVLDVGCGSGWYAVYFEKEDLQKNLIYNGTDLSENMCANAKNNFSNGNFFVSDVVKNSFNKKYDIIMEAAVLELVTDWKMALKNMLIGSNRWFIAHRLFITYGETIEEQVKTYFDLPDMRVHIGWKEFINILKNEEFDIIKEDVWHVGAYTMGTFIAKRI